MSIENLKKFNNIVTKKENYRSAGPNSEEEITISEKKLNLKFSKQNRFYYENIGYTSYTGHEFFGIMPNDNSDVLEGNSVAYALNDRKEYGLPVNWLPFYNFNDGDMAYLDYSILNQDGEPRVISAYYNGDNYEIIETLAEDLGDFLYEIVEEE